MINKNNFLKNIKGQGLPLNTIVIAILVVIVMVVVIMMFNGGTKDAQKDMDNLGDGFSGCSIKNTLYSMYDVVGALSPEECKTKGGTRLISSVEKESEICCGYNLKKETSKTEEKPATN